MASPNVRGTRSARERENTRRMLLLAAEAGCQLLPASNNPNQSRGFCPFHHATTTNALKTLRVDHSNGSFTCAFCQATGNPAIFAAMYWGVSVPEAYQLLGAPDTEISTTRPLPIALRPPESDKDPRYRRQNSYVLTQAAAYYAERLERARPAQLYLSRLGLSRPQTERLQLGYATGTGLLHQLRKAGVADAEIASNPLFNADAEGNFTERYHDLITIPNRDLAGNTSWLLLVSPASPDFDEAFPRSPGRVLHLRGLRPFTLGALNLPQHPTQVGVTDDIRVWLVLQAAAIPTIYLVGENEPNTDSLQRALRRTAAAEIIVACHRNQTGQQVGQQFREQQTRSKVTVLDSRQAWGLLPAPRDVKALLTQAAADPAMPPAASTPPPNPPPSADPATAPSGKPATANANTQYPATPDTPKVKEPFQGSGPRPHHPPPQSTAPTPDAASPSDHRIGLTPPESEPAPIATGSGLASLPPETEPVQLTTVNQPDRPLAIESDAAVTTPAAEPAMPTATTFAPASNLPDAPAVNPTPALSPEPKAPSVPETGATDSSTEAAEVALTPLSGAMPPAAEGELPPPDTANSKPTAHPELPSDEVIDRLLRVQTEEPESWRSLENQLQPELLAAVSRRKQALSEQSAP